jgi:hypothetical protein
VAFLTRRTHLLNPGEKATFYSAAHLKHRGIFHTRPQLKPRLLILTDQARLLCVKTSAPTSWHAEETHKNESDTSAPIVKIKTEVLLATVFASSPTRSSPMPPTPASSRRGSSVGQGGGGLTKRRSSVSTTASRISIRGRSVHRRNAEVLMGVETTKGDGTLVIQTVRRRWSVLEETFTSFFVLSEWAMVYLRVRWSSPCGAMETGDPCVPAATIIS